MASKFIVSASEFQSALKILHRFRHKVANGCEFVTVDARKDAVALTARVSGGYLSATIKAVDVQRTGKFTVSLAGLAAASQSDDTVTIADEDGSVAVRTAARVVQLVPDKSEHEMPATSLGGGFAAPSQWFADAMRDALACVATDTSRYAISGVLVSAGKGSLEVRSTDGRRLFHASCKNAGEFHAIVCKDTAKMVVSIGGQDAWLGTNDKGTVFLSTTHKNVIYTIAATQVEGTFPPCSDIIAECAQKNAAILTAETSALAAAMREAKKFTHVESRGVRVSYASGRVTLTAHSPETGTATQYCDVRAHGTEPWQDIGLNPDFVLDALASCRTPEVRITMRAANKPAVFYGSDRLTVIMPVTLSDATAPKPETKPETKAKTPAKTKTKPATITKAATPVPPAKETAMPKPTPKTAAKPQPAPAPESKPDALSPHARALVDALAKIGTPAVKATMLQTAGIPASAWSDALSEAYRARRITRDRSRTDNVYHVLAK